MHDEPFKLTRRKALAGLGTIGVAGAGAGLGTSALFSDEESFEGNIVQAGTLDMTVTAEVEAHVDNAYWNGLDLSSTGSEEDAAVAIDVKDIKPGDWAILCFTVDIEENPGYVTIHAKNFSEAENGQTEPESGDDDTPDNGDLDEKLLLTYWEQYDDTGDRGGLSGLDNITNAASPDFYSGSWQESDEDGVVSGQSNPDVEYTNVREFYFGRDGDETSIPDGNDPLGAGFASGDGILVGGSTNPVRVGADNVNDRRRLSNADDDAESELVFYLLFDLPASVGNEIQGDSVSFDLVFNTEQVRNNDDARSGRWEGYVGS